MCIVPVRNKSTEYNSSDLVVGLASFFGLVSFIYVAAALFPQPMFGCSYFLLHYTPTRQRFAFAAVWSARGHGGNQAYVLHNIAWIWATGISIHIARGAV